MIRSRTQSLGAALGTGSLVLSILLMVGSLSMVDYYTHFRNGILAFSLMALLLFSLIDREHKLPFHWHSNAFFYAFLIFVLYAMSQIAIQNELHFAVRNHALRFPFYFLAALSAYHFVTQRRALRAFIIVLLGFTYLLALAIIVHILLGLGLHDFTGKGVALWPASWHQHPLIMSLFPTHFYTNHIVYFFELTAFIPLALLMDRVLRMRLYNETFWRIGSDSHVLIWGISFCVIAGTIFMLLSTAF